MFCLCVYCLSLYYYNLQSYYMYILCFGKYMVIQRWPVKRKLRYYVAKATTNQWNLAIMAQGSKKRSINDRKNYQIRKPTTYFQYIVTRDLDWTQELTVTQKRNMLPTDLYKTELLINQFAYLSTFHYVHWQHLTVIMLARRLSAKTYP